MSQQPVPGTRTNSGHGAGSSVVPYLALHPMGFSVPPRLRLERWALTPPFHPYPACNFKIEISGLAVCFLWHCPSGRLTASPPACIPQSAFLRRQLQVTRHRALWCSDFPPPRNYSGKRFSAFPKSPLIYGRNARMQVDKGPFGCLKRDIPNYGFDLAGLGFADSFKHPWPNW